MQIEINIANKIATPKEDYKIVCGNSNYKVIFTFDAEWDNYNTKTARFHFTKDGINKYVDVEFDGNECYMPVLSNTAIVLIGVFAGNLQTTSRCVLECEKSILCENGVPEELPENIYNQVNEAIEDILQTQKNYMEAVSK